MIYYFGTGAFFAIVTGIAFGYVVPSSQKITATTVISLMGITIVGWPLAVPFMIFAFAREVHGYNPIMQMILAPDEKGYWLRDSRGNYYPFGSAYRFIVTKVKQSKYSSDELSITKNGRILTAPGVTHYGDVFEQERKAPIVGVVAIPNFAGYYVFTQAGEVFDFGKADFFGQLSEAPSQYNITWPGFQKGIDQPAQEPEEETVLPMSAKPAPA